MTEVHLVQFHFALSYRRPQRVGRLSVIVHSHSALSPPRLPTATTHLPRTPGPSVDSHFLLSILYFRLVVTLVLRSVYGRKKKETMKLRSKGVIPWCWRPHYAFNSGANEKQIPPRVQLQSPCPCGTCTDRGWCYLCSAP